MTATGGEPLDFSATTFTYTPYLLIGSGAADVSQDTVITGTSYQELYTNFPLSSSVLTGLFLEIDTVSANDTASVYTHTIYDRLGPAARQGNASANLSLPSPPAPALTDFDLATVNINTARQPVSSLQAQQTRLTNAYNNYEAIKAELASVPTTGTLTDSQQEDRAAGDNPEQVPGDSENDLVTMAYDASADVVASQLDTGYFVRVYPNSARLTVAQSSYNAGNSSESLDVLKNDMVVIGGLGQASKSPYLELVALVT